MLIRSFARILSRLRSALVFANSGSASRLRVRSSRALANFGSALRLRSNSAATKDPAVPTRNGHDWADRFPAIVDAALRIKAASLLIDGEA